MKRVTGGWTHDVTARPTRGCAFIVTVWKRRCGVSCSSSCSRQHVVQQRSPAGHQLLVRQQRSHAAAAAAPGAAAALRHQPTRVQLYHSAVSPLPAGPRPGGGQGGAGGLHGAGQNVPAAVQELRQGAVRGLPAAAPLQVLHLRNLQVREGQVSRTHALRW